jgi:hypothetical protein
MGLLGFLFGAKASPKSVSVDVHPEYHEPSEKQLKKAESYLKEAVKLKKTDIDEAAISLRKAYSLDKKYDLRLETDKYTRLPKYLQNAGRSSDALDEMGRLTAYGTPLSKRTYSSFSYHLSECHSAFAIIKKKQKVSPEEIAAEKCLADIYDLNGFLWKASENLACMGISESSKEYKEEEKWSREHADEKVRRIEKTYPQLKGNVVVGDLSFPMKNINEQDYYDAFMSPNG